MGAGRAPTWLPMAVIALMGVPAGSAVAVETVSVVLDQAKIIKIPDRVATIIIGNPLIADAALQSGGLMVLTGKGYGVTNLLALDRSGTVLMERQVQVEGPQGNVVVYRGADRESYSCAPDCQRRVVLGDSTEYFDAAIGQSGKRTGQALSGGTAAQGGGQAGR